MAVVFLSKLEFYYVKWMEDIVCSIPVYFAELVISWY